MAKFYVNIAEGAYEKVKAALAAVEHEFEPIETEVETDVKAAISKTESLLTRNGGQLLLSEALAVVEGVVTGNWSATVTTLIANAKASGAETLTEEEQLAGSTALQIAQVIKAQQAAPVAVVEAAPVAEAPVTA